MTTPTTLSPSSSSNSTSIDWRPLDLLAQLLVYPRETVAVRAALLGLDLEAYPEIHQHIEAACATFAEKPLHELEELYTQTFDLNPMCTLEVGWHLYGEQYERGRFLVRTRDLLIEAGIDEAGELPDFLPSLLRALPRLSPQHALDVASYLVPALRRMCDSLNGEADAKESKLYGPILVAVRDALEARVPLTAIEEAEARFRPVTAGGRKRGLDPGPNGDFPTQQNQPNSVIKLGVPGEAPPPGGVAGLPLSEFIHPSRAPQGAADEEPQS